MTFFVQAQQATQGKNDPVAIGVIAIILIVVFVGVYLIGRKI